MKHLLPKTVKNPKGFTLIELLVVIAILAVLATIGFAAFTGIAGRGNDGKRRADVKAVADAIENKRTTLSLIDYNTIAVFDTDFAGGVVPPDPTTGQAYCISTSTSAVVGNPAVTGGSQWPATGCSGGGLGLSGWTAVTSGYAIATSGTKYFKVCAGSQDRTTAYCVGSRQ